MIRNEKCKVLDKQNFEPKYRRVYDTCNSITLKSDEQSIKDEHSVKINRNS